MAASRTSDQLGDVTGCPAPARPYGGRMDDQVHVQEIAEHVWVVSVRGEYDMANVADIEHAIAEVFDAGSTVLLDLTQTTFIDSSVLNAIVRAHQTAANSATHHLLVIAPRGGAPRRVIDLILPNYISLHERLPEALDALHSL
jgi:anti-anti-sigma factor